MNKGRGRKGVAIGVRQIVCLALRFRGLQKTSIEFDHLQRLHDEQTQGHSISKGHGVYIPKAITP